MKIIMVGGNPATGKSTFSMDLSRRLRIPCFNKDLIREVMADGFGIEHVDFLNNGKKGSIAAYRLLLHIAEIFMQTGSTCIIESNFSVLYPQPVTECEQYKILIEKYSYECLTFAFTGDHGVLARRYIERDDVRHWVHVRASGIDEMKDYCARNKLDEIDIGRTVKVDTTSFGDVDFEGLYGIAEGFIYG
jgi:cytidylate kinase